MWNPFKKKEKINPAIAQIPPTNVPGEVPYPEGELSLAVGRLVFLGAVPFYVTNVFPMDQSLTLKRLNPTQWKELQENAKKLVLAAAKKKEEIKGTGTARPAFPTKSS